MYEEYFGLDSRPFGETVDPSAYLELPSREAALRRLRYGIERRDGPAVLFGPPGSGKTLLARKLAEAMGAASLVSVFPGFTASDLLYALADGLGEPCSPGASASVLVKRVGQAVARAAARGARPLLVVDEAQVLQDEAPFEALRLLLNFTSSGPPDLALLLVGTADLVLQMSVGMENRLAARCLLGPLSESEAADYVAGRLSAAGASRSLFLPEALAELHVASDGIPRRLNHLADLALLIAYAEERPAVDRRIVAVAAREFSPDPLAA